MAIILSDMLDNVYGRYGNSQEKLLQVSAVNDLYDFTSAIYFFYLGEACSYLIEMEDVLGYNKKALPIFRAINSRLGEANCLRSLGDYFRLQGSYESSSHQYTAALNIFSGIGNREGEAECLEGFAKLHEAREDRVQALDYWQKATELYEALGMSKRAQPCYEAAEHLRRIG